jgi:hypothetical protein
MVYPLMHLCQRWQVFVVLKQHSVVIPLEHTSLPLLALPEQHSVAVPIDQLLVIHRQRPHHVLYHAGDAVLLDLLDPLLHVALVLDQL